MLTLKGEFMYEGLEIEIERDSSAEYAIVRLHREDGATKTLALNDKEMGCLMAIIFGGEKLPEYDLFREQIEHITLLLERAGFAILP